VRAVLLAFAVAFVAEIGDKSQLLVLGLATRYRPWPVLGGLVLATVLVMGASVGVGAVLGAALPTTLVSAGAGLLFLAFGGWTLWERTGDADGEEARAERATARTHSVVLGVAAAVFLAELGDKTMLATVALAARESPLGTWIGASLGMVAGSGIALVAGALLGKRLPARATRIGAAALFALFGVLLLADALRSLT
jgi:Ca2+/H+ antiporter, TMEM165/GDT1 family